MNIVFQRLELNLVSKLDLTLFKTLAWMSWRVKHGSKHFSIASKGSRIADIHNYRQKETIKYIIQKTILWSFYNINHTTENVDPLFVSNEITELQNYRNEFINMFISLLLLVLILSLFIAFSLLLPIKII